jgi:spore coat polysaccharide biosynthesis protein SpsF (cytidylyltransferase family)
MRTLAFVQARMTSSRLPGKVLATISGKPALQRVVERLGRSSGLDGVVVLTSSDRTDDPIAELVERTGVGLFRGSLDDVLDRFRAAAVEFGAERVVRITADCPLTDPEVVDRLVEMHDRERGLGYAAVAVGAAGVDSRLRRFPNGLDAEIFPTAALERAWAAATDSFDREHVTPYIKRRLSTGSDGMLEAEEDWGDERWTVDYPEDLAFVRAIYGRLDETPFGYREVLGLLRSEPKLRQINSARRA